MKFPIVLVVWGDAWADMESTTVEEAKANNKPKICRSVGFLIERDDVCITLQGCCYDEDEELDRKIVIPVGIVQQVIKLKDS